MANKPGPEKRQINLSEIKFDFTHAQLSAIGGIVVTIMGLLITGAIYCTKLADKVEVLEKTLAADEEKLQDARDTLMKQTARIEQISPTVAQLVDALINPNKKK